MGWPEKTVAIHQLLTDSHSLNTLRLNTDCALDSHMTSLKRPKQGPTTKKSIDLFDFSDYIF